MIPGFYEKFQVIPIVKNTQRNFNQKEYKERKKDSYRFENKPFLPGEYVPAGSRIYI
jgi:hypothetical protein